LQEKKKAMARLKQKKRKQEPAPSEEERGGPLFSPYSVRLRGEKKGGFFFLRGGKCDRTKRAPRVFSGAKDKNNFRKWKKRKKGDGNMDKKTAPKREKKKKTETTIALAFKARGTF